MDVSHVLNAFRERYGIEPETVGIAPGRVNLIGEHTDYNDGFVFPAAIDKEVVVVAARTDGPSEMWSEQLGVGASFDVDTLKAGSIDTWSKYPAGMAWVLGHCSNLKALVHGTVPVAAGISSSAAMELAFGVVWNQLDRLEIQNADLARAGQKCENQFIGLQTGLMDQMASAMGQADHALFFDTYTGEIRYAPLADDIVIVLCDTTKSRELAGSQYNERRAECEVASQTLGVPSLRFATLEGLLDKKSELTDVVFRRARHIITENARCLSFATALETNNLEAVGELMRASHESLRYDYEVSCDELDAMAESAWNAPGVIGARMTGAGFGGACVALVHQAHVQEFMETTGAQYLGRTGRSGNFMTCRAADGARIVWP